MLKPPVLTGGVVRPIAGNPRLRCPVRGIGRLSAGFADALLARYGLLSGGDLYPDALLVFREAEEREAAQTAGDVQLTQLTLRLALQLSEYVSVTGGQPPSPMELHSLSRSLTTCLTTLERRDTATCREIRLLLKSLSLKNDTAPAAGKAAIQLARQTVERRLERLEIRERLSPSAPTAQTERRPFFPRTPGSVPGQTEPPADRQRERPIERQEHLIRQTDTQLQTHRETRHHSETHSIHRFQSNLPQQPDRQPETASLRQSDGQWESDRPRQESRQEEKGQSRRELPTDRAADTDRLLPQETPRHTRLSMDIPRLVGAVQAEQAEQAAHPTTSPRTDGTAVRPAPQAPINPMTRRPAPAAQLREQALTVQKERLLRLLSVTDESERETIWQLVEHRLINRHSIETDTQADTMERLTRTIRQSTYEEYTRLLQLLEQRFQTAESAVTPQAPAPNPSGTEVAPDPVTLRPSERQPDAPSGGATAQSVCPTPPTKQVLLQQAAPILTWLEQTLAAGNVPRRKLLTLLKDSPAPVQTAFLTLAEQSGVFEKTWSTAKSGEHLTLLARSSQRRELETLLRWTYVREAPAALGTPASPSAQETVASEEPSHSGEGESPSPTAAELAAESAAMANLRHFLSETRLTRRQELTALISAAPAEERQALLQELETASGDRELPTYAALGETERLVYLMEHSRDLPDLHRRLEASAPLRQLEQSRVLERELLRRLTAYTQERGGDRTEAAAHLLDGLSETGQQALLVQLRRVPGQTADKASPADSLSPTTSATSTTSADAPAQQVRELLAFRTQKEYKSFRYQLTQFLRERESPPAALAPTLTRWLTERRQSEARELAQAAAPLIARRPAAWYQALLGKPMARTDGSQLRPPVVSDDPAPWAMPPQPQTLRLSRTTQRQTPLLSPTETPASPDALQAGLLRSLAAGEGDSAVRLLRLLQPPPGVVEAALADLKAALPPPPPPPQRQARPPIARQSPLSLRRMPLQSQPQTQMQSQTQSQAQPQSQPQMQLQAQSQLQSQIQRQIQRSPELLSPLLSQRRELHLLETILQERETRIGKRPAPQLPRKTAAEQVPHPPLSPLTQRIGTPMAALGQRTAALRPTLSPAPLLGRWTEPTAARQLAHHRPPTAEGMSPTGQTMPPPLSPAGTAPVYPAVETELELRRRQSVQEVRETVTQTAAQTAARTVEQQLPALQLLRRQTLEQEQTLGKQQKSLGALQTQLERQEILIQQVLERAAVPAGSTPAEVRKMTKAVLQEMESQLRVERQRRGLL